MSDAGASDAVRGSVAAYDTHAEAYTAWSADLTLPVPQAKFVARLAPGATVLDAGCGAGRDLVEFAKVGVPCVGVDLSAGPLGSCTGPVVQGDLRALPFGPARFGGIWSVASLVHLDPAGARAALEEYRRVLRPSGVVFVMVKAGQDSSEWVDTEWGRRWFHFWSAGAFDALLDDCGLIVVETDESESSSSTAARGATTWLERHCVLA